MLKNLLDRLRPADPASDEARLALQAENQRLRLELAAAQEQARRLQESLARQQAAAGQAAAAQGQALLAELALPAAQFLTQLHLAETQGKALQAQDTLAVARRLWSVLRAAGVEVSEAIGEQAAFDPDRHQPLGAPLQPGAAVVVRTPGLALRQAGQPERRLVKAGVQPNSPSGEPA